MKRKTRQIPTVTAFFIIVSNLDPLRPSLSSTWGSDKQWITAQQSKWGGEGVQLAPSCWPRRQDGSPVTQANRMGLQSTRRAVRRVGPVG